MDALPLGRLPAELRNEIYELALSLGRPIPVWYQHVTQDGTETQTLELRTTSDFLSTLALTTTCRQLRRETADMFFACNAFSLEVRKCTSARGRHSLFHHNVKSRASNLADLLVSSINAKYDNAPKAIVLPCVIHESTSNWYIVEQLELSGLLLSSHHIAGILPACNVHVFVSIIDRAGENDRGLNNTSSIYNCAIRPHEAKVSLKTCAAFVESKAQKGPGLPGWDAGVARGLTARFQDLAAKW